MQQPPQNPNNPTGQPWSSMPSSQQAEQPSMPFSQPLSAPPPMQAPPGYNSAMAPGNPTGQPWQSVPSGQQAERPSMPFSQPLSAPPPMQTPPGTNSQPWQSVPSGQQAERPSMPFSQPLSAPPPPMQTPPPGYNPAMPPGNSTGQSWPGQQAERPSMPFSQPLSGPQTPMQTPPGYNPAMAPGAPWQQQQMYQQAQMQGAPMAVNINMGAQQQQPNGCVRAIYFVFVGWWLSLVCLELGFALCAFIITLPVGLIILNRIPQIMTLKPTKKTTQTSINMVSAGGANVMNVNMSVTEIQQRPMLIRALYFIFIGCWVGFIWANVAYLFCVSILGWPLGYLMLNMLPAVLTLRRN